MTTTYPTITNSTGIGNSQQVSNTFVPIQWSDEFLALREKKLLAAKFFKRFNFKGKPGDTIRIPFVTRTTPTAKTEGVSVNIVTGKEGKIDVAINKHYEISRQFEDILEIQSKYSLRSEYAKVDGYAMAELIDQQLLALPNANLPAAYKVIGSDGVTQYSGANRANITDAGILRAMQTLMDNKVDITECGVWICPSQMTTMLGIDKFTLLQYYGDAVVQKGLFGKIYGMPVFVSTNIETLATGDLARVCLIAHPDCMCSVIQQDVRFQTQYKLEYLATLAVADMLYGVKSLRMDADNTSTSNHRLAECVAIYTP